MSYPKTLAFFILFCLFSCSSKKQKEKIICNCSFDPVEYKNQFHATSNINFIVTGDPQYNYLEINPDQASALNADSVSSIVREKICCDHYRGLLVAGDLTHFARLDEFKRYQKFIAPFRPYVFDGLGNHDYAWAQEEAMDKEAYTRLGLGEIVPSEKMGWKKQCLPIWKAVRDRKRIVPINDSYPNLHYSWDWEEVHFLQLNVFPGMNTTRGRPAQNPFQSLSFLKKDLEEQVGNSGRPVILVHHYGLDFFSIGAPEEGAEINPDAAWWTPKDRQIYWDAIKNYNIIAIFSGHAHYCEQCYLPWDGQSIGEENVGADFIPTFVSGAARKGKYLECHINKDSLIVKRYNLRNLVFRKAFSIIRK